VRINSDLECDSVLCVYVFLGVVWCGVGGCGREGGRVEGK
jgi:hypothetical protein